MTRTLPVRYSLYFITINQHLGQGRWSKSEGATLVAVTLNQTELWSGELAKNASQLTWSGSQVEHSGPFPPEHADYLVHCNNLQEAVPSSTFASILCIPPARTWLPCSLINLSDTVIPPRTSPVSLLRRGRGSSVPQGERWPRHHWLPNLPEVGSGHLHTSLHSQNGSKCHSWRF